MHFQADVETKKYKRERERKPVTVTHISDVYIVIGEDKGERLRDCCHISSATVTFVICFRLIVPI